VRYFIYLEYCGTAYHGWQNQPNAISVQEVLEQKLSMLLRQPTTIVGAGRTDTGVHARLMVAHFDTEQPIDAPTLCFKMNGVLPDDIAIHKIIPVCSDAHARFSATSRTYEYWLTNRKSAFTHGLVTRTYLQDLDIDAMNEAAKILLEEHDFASFCKAGSDNKTTLCDVRIAHWEQRGACMVFTISADRFLRNMVRATVGTLIEVGRHRMSPDDLRNVLHSHSRCAAGESMPADGLYLVDIGYPDSIFPSEPAS